MLFSAIKLVRKEIKREFISNRQGMAFDREGSWTVSNDFARNVVIFGVDYSSLFHTYNRKNTFLVLVELMVVFQKIF